MKKKIDTTKEYFRRNLQVAKVIGATSIAENSINRLLNNKSSSNWEKVAFSDIIKRIEGLSKDLAEWRDLEYHNVEKLHKEYE
jgi:hypothetical protein